MQYTPCKSRSNLQSTFRCNDFLTPDFSMYVSFSSVFTIKSEKRYQHKHDFECLGSHYLGVKIQPKSASGHKLQQIANCKREKLNFQRVRGRHIFYRNLDALGGGQFYVCLYVCMFGWMYVCMYVCMDG